MRLAATLTGLLAAFTVAVVALPASARTTTVGSPMTRSPAGFGCETTFAPGGYTGGGEYEPFASGASTCTWWQGGPLSATGFVPGPGTVTRVRIKSGSNPAPLSIAIIRRTNRIKTDGTLEYFCCIGVVQGPTFRPTPNAITEVTVNLPVTTLVASGQQIGWYDVLAINGEGPGQLPIADASPHNINAPFDDSTIYAHWFHPKLTDQQYGNEFFGPGWELLVQYDWCDATPKAVQANPAACGVGPPRGATLAPTTAPRAMTPSAPGPGLNTLIAAG